MYKLLLVDNEPNIVKGLCRLFQEASALPVEICCAFSSDEAAAWIERGKIDIALLDIRMPGRSGLELQLLLGDKWPRCQVIFLTGYDDFQYIQTGMRHGGLDYLLKMEGDEAILQAVERAVAKLEHERQMNQLQRNSLRRDYLLRLLDEGGPSKSNIRQQDLDRLGIPLAVCFPVTMIMGRVDQWYCEAGYSDRSLLFYAIDNIGQEHLSVFALASIALDRQCFIWLVQPRTLPAAAPPDLCRQPEPTTSRLRAALGEIQEASLSAIRLPLSFIYAERSLPWGELPALCTQMKQLWHKSVGIGEQMLVSDGELRQFLAWSQAEESGEKSIGAKLRQISLLTSLLEHGKWRDFFACFEELAQLAQTCKHRYDLLKEVYFALALVLISHRGQMTGGCELPPPQETDDLLRFERYVSWEQAIGSLREYAEALCQAQEGDKRENRLIVQQLHQYIEEHIDGELSLQKLGEAVYLNPSYLCRLYKQSTGSSLTDKITETRLGKAKELLAQPQWKIQDIAAKVGLESPSYFGKLFKRRFNITPQMYRELELANRSRQTAARDRREEVNTGAET